jgi:hypothetical protein
LSSAGSRYNGMLLFQRRQDQRPIVFAQTSPQGGTLSGTIYAKWGNVLVAGLGTYNARIVAGTLAS